MLPAESQISRWLPIRFLFRASFLRSASFFCVFFCVFCALFSATSALSFLLQANIDSLYNEKHDHGRHDGTSTIADERKCHSGQRNELGTAANGQEYLENIHNTDAIYDQLIESVMNAYCHPHHFQKTADTDQDQTYSEDHAQFLADGRKDKVRFHIRNRCGITF